MPLKKDLSRGSRLYLVLDKDACVDGNLKWILKKALAGGVDIVQLRDKLSCAKDMIERAIGLLGICRSAGVPFIINDRLDVALAIGADGLHLGQDDLPVRYARKILGAKKMIGLSCHSINDIKRAQLEECDYLGFGPVFKTLTKPDVQPLGIAALKKAIKISKKPVFAIGGITEDKINGMKGHGPLNIAVIREICLSGNPEQAAKRLKEKISNV